MANTITNTTIHQGLKRVAIHFALTSDGTQETDTVIYDSSAIATALGISDPLDSSIVKVEGCLNVLAETAVTVSCKLEFDATTDTLAVTIPKNRPFCFDWQEINGLHNTSGAGKTGDITITTTGLAASDTLVLTLYVKPD